MLLRSLLGSVFLLAVFFITGRKFTFPRHRRDLLFIAVSGAAMAADWLFLFAAYTRIGVSLSLIINYCGPAIVMALSPLVFKERITWPKLAALFAALLGAFLISGRAAAGGASISGLVFAGLSAVSYAAMVIFNKLTRDVKGTENATLQMLFAFAVIAVFLGCRRGISMDILPGDWPYILWLGLLNTGVGCWFYFSSIGVLPVQTVAVCGYLEPLAAVMLSVLFLNEILAPLQLVGAALIIGGAVLGECMGTRAKE